MRTYQNLILSKVHVISTTALNYKVNKTRYHNCFFSNDKKLITIIKAVI